jgi:hypothetical protein
MQSDNHPVASPFGRAPVIVNRSAEAAGFASSNWL